MSYQPIPTAPKNESEINQPIEKHTSEEPSSYQQYQPSQSETEIETQPYQQEEEQEQEIEQQQIITENGNAEYHQNQQIVQQQYYPPYSPSDPLYIQPQGYSYQNQIQIQPNQIISPMHHEYVVLSDSPQHIYCPYCHKEITTYVETSLSVVQAALCFLFCFMGLCCIACIFCCIPSLSQFTHICPECKRILGNRADTIVVPKQ